MTELIAVSTAHTLLLALVALLLVWGALRLLDKAAGRPFCEAMEVIRADSRAAAVYYGARFIGACLLVGLAI